MIYIIHWPEQQTSLRKTIIILSLMYWEKYNLNHSLNCHYWAINFLFEKEVPSIWTNLNAPCPGVFSAVTFWEQRATDLQLSTKWAEEIHVSLQGIFTLKIPPRFSPGRSFYLSVPGAGHSTKCSRKERKCRNKCNMGPLDLKSSPLPNELKRNSCRAVLAVALVYP